MIHLSLFALLVILLPTLRAMPARNTVVARELKSHLIGVDPFYLDDETDKQHTHAMKFPSPEYKLHMYKEDGLYHDDMENDIRELKYDLVDGWRKMAPMTYKKPLRPKGNISERLKRLRQALDQSRLEIDGRPAAIVVPFNAAWLKVAMHVDCSLKAAGVDNIFYWALDEKAYTLGLEHGLNTYYDSRFQSSTTQQSAGLFTEAYTSMMRQRPRFWLDVMNNGYDMIFLDADISVLKNPVDYIQNKISRIRDDGSDGIVPDIIMQMDESEVLPKSNEYRWTEGCAGFFYMRSTEGMKRIMKKLAHLLDLYADMAASGKYAVKKWHWNDQTGLMFLLDKHALIKSPDGIWNENPNAWVRLEFFDQFDFANGHIVFESDEKRIQLFETKPAGSVPVLIHANGQRNKLKAFKDMKIHFFDDESKMTCKSFDTQAFLKRVFQNTGKNSSMPKLPWFKSQYYKLKHCLKRLRERFASIFTTKKKE